MIGRFVFRTLLFYCVIPIKDRDNELYFGCAAVVLYPFSFYDVFKFGSSAENECVNVSDACP